MVSTVGMSGMRGISMGLTIRYDISSVLVFMLSSWGYCWGGYLSGVKRL